MKHHDDLFQPEYVDEQIEYFARNSEEQTPSRELLRDVQQIYSPEAREDVRSLTNAWQRISTRLHDQGERSHADMRLTTMQTLKRPDTNFKPDARHAAPSFWRFPVLNAAVLVILLVVGSLIFTLNVLPNVTGPGPATPTPVLPSTPPPAPTPTPILEPTPTPAPTPTPIGEPTPAPSCQSTPSCQPTPTPTPTPVWEPTPTPIP